jgi:hypothetical protein
VAWLAAALAERPAEVRRARWRCAAGGPAGQALAALDAKLATAQGLARHAWLAAVTYEGGRRAISLPSSRRCRAPSPALARAVGEALTFSGVEAGELDVGFFAEGDPGLARIAKVGLRFDLPEPDRARGAAGPGMDPDRPPRLR